MAFIGIAGFGKPESSFLEGLDAASIGGADVGVDDGNIRARRVQLLAGELQRGGAEAVTTVLWQQVDGDDGRWAVIKIKARLADRLAVMLDDEYKTVVTGEHTGKPGGVLLPSHRLLG